MIRLRPGVSFWVLLILLGISLYISVILGDRLHYRWVYLWLSLLVVCFFWARMALSGLELKRSTRSTRIPMGQIFDEKFVVVNHSRWIKTWCTVIDRSDFPNHSSSRTFTWIGGRQQRTYIVHTVASKRGYFQLGKTLIRSGDLFGVFTVEKEVSSEYRLLVTPCFTSLDSFPIGRGILAGGRALRQKTLEVTPFAAGVREYLSGDSLNQIHWPTSVRHDRLMVKEFDQDPQTDIWVFIDTFKEVQIQVEPRTQEEKIDQALRLLSLRPSKEQYEIPRNSIDYECIVGATVINHLILKNETIGFAAYSNQIRIHQPEKGERHLIKILEELATLDGKSNWSISEVIQTLMPGLAKGTTLIIITPELSTALTTTLDVISMRKMHPILIWINLSGAHARRIEQEKQLRTILDHKITVFEVPEIQVLGDLTRILRQNDATSHRNQR